MKAQKDVTCQECLWSILASSNELCFLTMCCPQAEGGVSSALLSAGEATPGGQSASTGLPREKRNGCTGQHLVMGHTDDDGASLLQPKAESWAWPRGGSGGVSSIRVSAWRDSAKKMEPGSFLWCPQEGQSQWAHTGTQEALWLLMDGSVCHQKALPLWAGPSPGTGCPGRLWGLHPCRYQKSSGHGVGRLAVDGPAWAWGLDEMIFSASSQHQPPCRFCDSMILWFFDTIFMQNHPLLWRKYSNQIWVTWNTSLKKIAWITKDKYLKEGY